MASHVPMRFRSKRSERKAKDQPEDEAAANPDEKAVRSAGADESKSVQGKPRPTPAYLPSSSTSTEETAQDTPRRTQSRVRDPPKTTVTTSTKPRSIYPAFILGSAMVARGEIGFLISAIAESNGIFGSEPNGPIFLVVTWAIMLCTIIGPLTVGTLVRRVKRLEAHSSGNSAGVLGEWGLR
jgi:hypothetical protein